MLKHVKTKYVLLVQHDFFIQKVDIHKVIEDMEKDSKLKNVRFNQFNNNKLLMEIINIIFIINIKHQIISI